ncbi:MAG: GntR family transcriptional regulator [Collinsella sp.]
MAFDDKTDRTDVSAVPLYQQVMDDLKGEIARRVRCRLAHSFRDGAREVLRRGRVTVRRAIEELSRAGYLNRQQGRGTFVCAPKLKRKIRQKGDVQSFTEGCAANDMVPGARLVSRTVVAATHEDAAFFGVEPGCELWSSACARPTASRHAREQRLCARRPSLPADAGR